MSATRPDPRGSFPSPPTHTNTKSFPSTRSEEDSENYDANNESSPSTTSSPSRSASNSNSNSNSTPLILYSPPTIWGLLRGAAINLILPFVNGLMLGFGELFAHEIAFRWGWAETKVFPDGRAGHSIGPGIEIRDDPIEKRRREGEELEMYTSLE